VVSSLSAAFLALDVQNIELADQIAEDFSRDNGAAAMSSAAP
jgi:hypothetical protein